MRLVKTLAVIVTVSMLLNGVVYAEAAKATANKQQDWEKVEEPALRPYKSLWRGFKSVVYNTVKSFEQGNEKLPVLGSVEAFRGARRGALELTFGTYMGMAGSKPKDYRSLGKTNQIIEADPLLRNVVDAAPPLLTHYPVHIIVAQKAVDHSPVAPEQYKQEMKDRKKSRMDNAQNRKFYKEADIKRRSEGRGNFLKHAPSQ